MGVQRRYTGVEGICRRVRGYMGVQRRYKGVEGICRRVRGYVGVQRRYKGERVYVEGYGDMWKYRDDTNLSSKLTRKRTSKRKSSGHDRNIFGENHSETAKEK